MTQIVNGWGCGSSSSSSGTQQTDCVIDCSGATDGDPLVFNMATSQFEPLSQAGNPAQDAFRNAISALINSPTIQLP